jgi:hypothetical protein
MSHSFKSYPAKPSFAQFKEPTNSSDYITQKKIQNLFKSYYTKNCYSKCKKPINASDYIIQKNIQYSFYHPNEINKNQLYINLITKLQLNNDIPVIIDNTNGISPSLIDLTQNPTTRYTIDPDGILFGNNICTINNWENYVVYNKLK